MTAYKIMRASHYELGSLVDTTHINYGFETHYGSLAARDCRAGRADRSLIAWASKGIPPC